MSLESLEESVKNLATPIAPIALDDEGNTIFRKEDGRWDTLKEIDMRIERFVEEHVMNAFPDALLNDGDQVYVRRIGGRLQWIKGNVYGGGESWKELTPVTAKHLEIVGDHPEIRVTSESEAQAELRKRVTLEQIEYAVGWYQDDAGTLYQYSGSEWVGTVPSKKQIETLEFLG